jgi:hypothetical protein
MNEEAIVPRRPGKGETLIAHDFQMYVGGKGNNQSSGAEPSLPSMRSIDDFMGVPQR